MKPTGLQRRSLKTSLALHGAVLLVALAGPWLFKACNRSRPNEKLMFVEFTVSIPPPPAPDVPAPETPPEPPPDQIPEVVKQPDKNPDPPKPEPPKPIKQTNRVVRTVSAPPPKDKPLSPAEIEALLKRGAKIGSETVVPPDNQIAMAAYFDHVHEKMYAAWQQPAQLKNLPGLRTTITISVTPQGRIVGRRKIASSGNALMDESVMDAVNKVSQLKPLPAGIRSDRDIDVHFEIAP